MNPSKGERLATYWTVGFTGHRTLAEPAKISQVIASELQNAQALVAGKLAAVSSIASGGDTLFAQQVIAAGIPWIAFLPFPREEFRKDFQGAGASAETWAQRWQEAEECLSQAIFVEELQQSPERPAAYQDDRPDRR